MSHQIILPPSALTSAAGMIATGAVLQIDVMLYQLPPLLQCRSVSFKVGAGGVGLGVAVALYNAYDRSRLIYTGEIEATTGIKTYTLGTPTDIPGGWYWLAWCADDEGVKLMGVDLATDWLGILDADNGDHVISGETIHQDVIAGKNPTDATNPGGVLTMPTTLGVPVTAGVAGLPVVKFQGIGWI